MEASSKCSSDDRTLYGFKDETLDGEHLDYSKYKGDVVLMVNVATFWGLTKAQYHDLNALVRKFKGPVCSLKVFGVPCNQFGYQEPGEKMEIPNGLKYVRPGNGFVAMFPLLKKREINGEKEDELYTWFKVHELFFFCFFFMCMVNVYSLVQRWVLV